MYFSGKKSDFLPYQPSTGTIGSSAYNNSSTELGNGGENADTTSLVFVLITFYILVALLAMASNIIILVTVIFRYVSRNTVNIFLCSLAASDLTMVILSMLDFATFLIGSWVFSEEVCKFQSYVLEISFTASTLTLVAVSVERYLLICRPYTKRRSHRSIYKILIGVWVVAAIICAPLLHGYAVTSEINIKTGDVEKVCHNYNWGKKGELGFYAGYSVITYIFPLVVMSFAHWRISVSVKENNDRRASAQSTLIKEKKSSVCYTIREEPSSTTSTEKTATEEIEPAQPQPHNGLSKTFFKSISGLSNRTRSSPAIAAELTRREKRMNAIRLLFVVTVIFFTLWTPFIFMRLIRDAGVEVYDIIYKFSEIIIFSSTAVNGLIYAFMSRPFRNAFKAILCCKTRRELVSRDSGPSMSNSEDNRLSNRANSSRGSSVSYTIERNGTLPKTKMYSSITSNGTNGKTNGHV